MKRIEILKHKKELYESLISKFNILKEKYSKEIEKINEEIEREDLYISSINAKNPFDFMYIKLSDSSIEKKLYYK